MTGDSPPPSPSRAKTSKTSDTGMTAGTVRQRVSPAPGGSNEQSGDARPPPPKRVRKAINCEPCRNSKLKCDRNRPCSSCVLRGTSAMCYRDSRSNEPPEPNIRGDNSVNTRVDPAQEVSKIRHSLDLLEGLLQRQRGHTVPRYTETPLLVPKKEVVDPDASVKTSGAPGLLASANQGGLFSGPTSAATHFLITESRNPEENDPREDGRADNNYDPDLLQALPSIDIIDFLIHYYFEYCNWIYKHVHQPSFTRHWELYKAGKNADRITLATACVIMAVAMHYLPSNHELVEGMDDTIEERAARYYETGLTALHRRVEETKAYSLELVELLLLRTHYLNMSKTDSEAVWRLRGELVSIALAMGLHRDPGKWGMPRDLAERRRWAWWHIILLERWQAFMFGRPIIIATHHFDTQLPSQCEPSIDNDNRYYLPNIALFRLAFIAGDIVDDAVSVRPVPFDSVQANDRALTQWMDNLPPELDLDEYRIARSFASPNPAQRRLGVQSMIVRTSYYHIRFTLHRPYCIGNNEPHTRTGASSTSTPPTPRILPKSSQSLEIAVNAADKLIQMTGSDYIGNPAHIVPGHMNWGSFHCFSAAMFFSFQLIANPHQPGAALFRSSVRNAIETIESSRGHPVSDKAYDILLAIAPLYDLEFLTLEKEARKKRQAQILSVVKKLAFPISDRQHDGYRHGAGTLSVGSGGCGGCMGVTAGSPTSFHSGSPSLAGVQPLGFDYFGAQLAGMPTDSGGYDPAAGYPLASPRAQSTSQAQHAQQHPPQPQRQQMLYSDPGVRYVQYTRSADETQMWGAAVGFNHGEWNQFLAGMRLDSGHGHSHGMSISALSSSGPGLAGPSGHSHDQQFQHQQQHQHQGYHGQSPPRNSSVRGGQMEDVQSNLAPSISRATSASLSVQAFANLPSGGAGSSSQSARGAGPSGTMPSSSSMLPPP